MTVLRDVCRRVAHLLPLARSLALARSCSLISFISPQPWRGLRCQRGSTAKSSDVHWRGVISAPQGTLISMGRSSTPPLEPPAPLASSAKSPSARSAPILTAIVGCFTWGSPAALGVIHASVRRDAKRKQEREDVTGRARRAETKERRGRASKAHLDDERGASRRGALVRVAVSVAARYFGDVGRAVREALLEHHHVAAQLDDHVVICAHARREAARQRVVGAGTARAADASSCVWHGIGFDWGGGVSGCAGDIGSRLTDTGSRLTAVALAAGWQATHAMYDTPLQGFCPTVTRAVGPKCSPLMCSCVPPDVAQRRVAGPSWEREAGRGRARVRT